jgi:succinate-acetate transporter protein
MSAGLVAKLSTLSEWKKWADTANGTFFKFWFSYYHLVVLPARRWVGEKHKRDACARFCDLCGIPLRALRETIN